MYSVEDWVFDYVRKSDGLIGGSAITPDASPTLKQMDHQSCLGIHPTNCQK